MNSPEATTKLFTVVVDEHLRAAIDEAIADLQHFTAKDIGKLAKVSTQTARKWMARYPSVAGEWRQWRGNQTLSPHCWSLRTVRQMFHDRRMAPVL